MNPVLAFCLIVSIGGIFTWRGGDNGITFLIGLVMLSIYGAGYFL